MIFQKVKIISFVVFCFGAFSCGKKSPSSSENPQPEVQKIENTLPANPPVDTLVSSTCVAEQRKDLQAQLNITKDSLLVDVVGKIAENSKQVRFWKTVRYCGKK